MRNELLFFFRFQVSANAASSPRTLLESKEALANYLKQKCLKNSNEKAYQALMVNEIGISFAIFDFERWRIVLKMSKFYNGDGQKK